MTEQPGEFSHNPDAAAPQQPQYDTSAEQLVAPPERKRAKGRGGLKAFIWTVVVIVVLVLALIISSKIAGFDTVFEMVDWILNPSNTGFSQK